MGIIQEKLDAFKSSMEACKNALISKGLSLSQTPRLTDLPALITAVGEGTTPALGAVTQRPLDESLNLMAPTLKQIEAALGTQYVSASDLKVSGVADKINAINMGKANITMCFVANRLATSSKQFQEIKGWNWGFMELRKGSVIKNYVSLPDNSDIPKNPYGWYGSNQEQIEAYKTYKSTGKFPSPTVYTGNDCYLTCCVTVEYQNLEPGTYTVYADKLLGNGNSPHNMQSTGQTIKVNGACNGMTFWIGAYYNNEW